MNGEADRVGGTSPSTQKDGGSGSARPPVKLRVVWGDLAEVEADVHAVGHYMGVLPTSAEQALDRAISGSDPARQIIAEHTRRQWFLGEFGHVNYFPPAVASKVKIAAVAGMGRLGTFGENRAAQLAENLLLELCALGHADHVAMVAIGSGAQNLSMDQTARALANGFAKALESTRMRRACTQIDIVEFDRLRAERLRRALVMVTKSHGALAMAETLATAGGGGGITFQSAALYALGAVIDTAAGPRSSELEPMLTSVSDPALAAAIVKRLAEGNKDELVDSAELSLQDVLGENPLPVRISVLESSSGGVRVAGITGTATVPERNIDADPRLIDEVVRRMNPPQPGRLHELSEVMSRLVLPGDLRSLVSPVFPLVFEVDRRTAQIHWELVADLAGGPAADGNEPRLPLILQQSVTRQLRTTYSRAPVLDISGSGELRVLVIGDPGGPKASLPGARAEALAVHDQLVSLKGNGVEVTTLIGAPGTTEEEGFKPAARLDVLQELLSGAYQVVHYCGHGTFDPRDQRRAGWYFADGLLTSKELAQMVGTPPRLVVANACFSSQLGVVSTASVEPTTPPAAAAGTAPSPGRAAEALPGAKEALLTPSLADEFLRAGVSNYLGAAWPVGDEEAVLFSATLYQRLLGERDALGAAVTEARKAVWNSYPQRAPASQRGTTWVVYQHYGDPADQLHATAPAPAES